MPYTKTWILLRDRVIDLSAMLVVASLVLRSTVLHHTFLRNQTTVYWKVSTIRRVGISPPCEISIFLLQLGAKMQEHPCNNLFRNRERNGLQLAVIERLLVRLVFLRWRREMPSCASEPYEFSSIHPHEALHWRSAR